MDSYRKHVRALADRRDGTPIFNGSAEHAAIITATMFAKANKEICILSGKMNTRVYAPDDVREQIEMFLGDDAHRLRIIIEDFSESNLTNHPFFDRFLDNENITVRGLPKDVAAKIPFHFLVMDSDSYRFERDKTKHEAVAAFGEKRGGENLSNVFESLWAASVANEIGPKKKRVKEYQ